MRYKTNLDPFARREEGSETRQNNGGGERSFFISRLLTLQYLAAVTLCLDVISPDQISIIPKLLMVGMLVGLATILLLLMIKPVLQVGPRGFKYLWLEPFEWGDIEEIVYFNVRGLASMKVTLDRAVLSRTPSRIVRMIFKAGGRHLWFRGWRGIDLEQLTDAIGGFSRSKRSFRVESLLGVSMVVGIGFTPLEKGLMFLYVSVFLVWAVSEYRKRWKRLARRRRKLEKLRTDQRN